jgi:hypothetical protein
MSQKDDLYDLVRSLSPSEKRYFKLHADKHSSSEYKRHYEKLFDALNNWPEQDYDEKEFKKRNRGKSFLKNLSAEKGYLYDLILKILRNYNSQNDPEIRLQEMIININLLINKGLKSQAYKLIEKAQKLADDTESFNEMQILNDCLMKLYRLAPGDAKYKANEIISRGEEVMGKWALNQRALHLRIQMVHIDTENLWKRDNKNVSAIVAEADTLMTAKGLSRRAALSLLNVKQFYLIHEHKYTEALSMTQHWLDKIEGGNKNYQYSTEQYLVTLSNYLMCALRSDRVDLLPQAIDKIKELKTLSEKEEADCFRMSAQYELVYMLNSKDRERSSKMILNCMSSNQSGHLLINS